jgi:hypothetical protein
MMGRTEERLRDATTALGSSLHGGDIPALRLPEAAGRSPGRRPALYRRLASRPWLVPVAAAASVIAVIGLVTVGVRALPGHAGPGNAGPGSTGRPAAASPDLPRYLVTTVDGQAAVRATASGQLIAAVPRPASVYAYEGVAAAPRDRTYFLAGAVNSSGAWKVAFFRVSLGPDGHPGPVQRLPGTPLDVPFPVISGGWMNFYFAVTPDGRQLAYASGSPVPYGAGTPYGPATTFPNTNERVVVQDVATGGRRTWSAWSSAEAVVSQLSWGPSGHLGYDIALADTGVSHHRLIRKAGGNVSAFMVLATTAPGSDLVRNSQVVSYSSSPRSGTPSGPRGVISPDGQLAYLQLSGAQAGSGPLVEASVATGATVRALLAGPDAAIGEPMSIEGGGRYLLFPVAVAHPRVVNSDAPYIAGHLARLDLRTGQVTMLSVPVMAEINGAFDAAW